MIRAASLVVTVVLWLAFCYAAVVTVFVHLVPHFLSSTLDQKLVLFIVVDVLLLQAIAWLYKKLPNRPASRAFSWLERVSLF